MARGQRGRRLAAAAAVAVAVALGAPGGAAGADKEKAVVQASRIEEHPVDVSIGGKGVQFGDLPGFTRSVVERDFALITPESRVWMPVPGWQHSLVAHVITPAPPMNAEFTMLLANMKPGGTSLGSPRGAERFVFVIEGDIKLTCKDSKDLLGADDFAYFPANYEYAFQAPAGALLVIYERQYVPPPSGGSPSFHQGSTEQLPNIETPGEIFKLKKLLPFTEHYDFNIHVMDFEPGEYLNVKEVHFNQHGLLMLEGQGVYRLGERWFSTKAGDVIWMAPFVPQWYGALGKRRTRYILYKDTNREPGSYGTQYKDYTSAMATK